MAPHLRAPSVPTSPAFQAPSCLLRWAPGAPAPPAHSLLGFIRLPPARSESGFPFSWTRFLTWALWRGSARRAPGPGSRRRSRRLKPPASHPGTNPQPLRPRALARSPFGQAHNLRSGPECFLLLHLTDPVGDGLFKEGKSPGWGPLSPAVQKGELARGRGRRPGHPPQKEGPNRGWKRCALHGPGKEGSRHGCGRLRGGGIHLAFGSSRFPVPELDLQAPGGGRGSWPLVLIPFQARTQMLGVLSLLVAGAQSRAPLGKETQMITPWPLQSFSPPEPGEHLPTCLTGSGPQGSRSQVGWAIAVDSQVPPPGSASC